MNIYKIALTGGPCAGKTTVFNSLKELLKKDGYYVITIPESATYLIQNGTPPLADRNHALHFQHQILNFQLNRENFAMTYCQDTLKTNPEFFKGYNAIIILCDRGIMDNRAYLNQEEYDNMLKRHNLNELELINSYDIVINLISLATTNKELYALDGIRYEDVETAAIRDSITSAAWLLHDNLKMIKPTKTIEEKIDLVYKLIKNDLVGTRYIHSEPVDLEKLNITLTDDNSKTSIITRHFINKDDFIIKTTYKDYECYELVVISPIRNIFTLTKEEYLTLYNYSQQNKTTETIITDFIHNGNHYRRIINENNDTTSLINNSILLKEIPKTLRKTRRNQNNMLI